MNSKESLVLYFEDGSYVSTDLAVPVSDWLERHGQPIKIELSLKVNDNGWNSEYKRIQLTERPM